MMPGHKRRGEQLRLASDRRNFAMTIHRRSALKGLAATGVGTAIFGAPGVLRGEVDPIRVGFLTVKTGPLASGGIQMEEGLTLYLKERNSTLSGRPVQVYIADTGGVPAITKSKAQELVERAKVHCFIGPLAAFEALAIDDYIRDTQTPTMSVAAAEDMTQRKPNPWFVRATSSSSQCASPMADYAAKELKYAHMATIADDIAYGHEMCAGFQQVFEDAGGRIVQKLWPPLNTPDYGAYVAQLKPDLDAIFLGFAGSNGFKFLKQYREYARKTPLLGGMTAIDESLLQQMGEDALGILSSCWYSADLDSPTNRKFVANMERVYKVDPGFYAAATYTNGAVLEAAVKAVGGRIEDKNAFMAALRTIKVPDTVRGPVSFDRYGNVVGNVYIRKVVRKGGKFVNAIVRTYPDVSQFWTYDPKAFLKNPVYSRDYPPARYLEQ
jgi:branched-chain amino acid transport system substrate-binding protein